jgi:hypothetical protein
MNNTSIGERISAVVDELFGYDDNDSSPSTSPIVPIVIGALLTLILVLAILVRIQRALHLSSNISSAHFPPVGKKYSFIHLLCV